MKPFRFQQFDVSQSKDVFRVGTDAVLLGALSELNTPRNILEVGCGSGIISLMLAQRFSHSKITAIDISHEAVDLTKKNIENTPFKNRLNVLQADYRVFILDEKPDAIICNPPYFEENSSIKDVLARQKKFLSFFDLIQKTSELISNDGIFSVILPSESGKYFEEIAGSFQLKLKRKINIFGIKNGALKRNILEFSKENRETEIQNFTIETSPRKYSDEYLEATRDFHLFNLK